MPDVCLIVVMEYVYSMIRLDHANHQIQVPVESTIPNHSFVNFVMRAATTYSERLNMLNDSYIILFQIITSLLVIRYTHDTHNMLFCHMSAVTPICTILQLGQQHASVVKGGDLLVCAGHPALRIREHNTFATQVNVHRTVVCGREGLLRRPYTSSMRTRRM